MVRKITEIEGGIFSNYDPRGVLRRHGCIGGLRGKPCITFLGRVLLAAYEEKCGPVPPVASVSNFFEYPGSL